MKIPQSGLTAADFATYCPSAGQGRADGDPLLVPIIQSTTFCRDGIDSDPDHKYSRESNPTVAALEKVLGDLENALPAACFATGLAAETALVLSTVEQGQHVICSRAVYGGTTRLLRDVLQNFGVATSFVDTTSVDAVRDAIRPETALIFLETPSNPTLDVTDLAAVAELARERGILTAVDNTFLTPLLQQPIELGCDVSVYSTTKFIEGHSAALGGALVTRNEALRDKIGFVRKCTGGIQSPLGAWLTLQGLKTLSLRLERQSENAQFLGEHLAARSDVVKVNYPSLEGFRFRELAERQHRGHHGAVLSFEIEGGETAAREFLKRVQIPRLVEHVGSVETLLTHSATMTHGAVPEAERTEVGVTNGLLRLSVGIEDKDRLLADLIEALDGASSGSASEKPACATS